MQFAAVNSQKIAYDRSGSGAHAVVLETGLGIESDAWKSVQRELSESSRVFRYDRLGRGESEGTNSLRTTADMVDDLRRLLTVTGTAGPYILVGHSFGGMIARLFAASFSDEVAGMVLVESMHRSQFSALGPLFPEAGVDDVPELQKMRAFWRGGWQSPDNVPEKIDFERSFAADAEIKTLGKLPIEVITSASFLKVPFIPPSGCTLLQEAWVNLQRDFLTLSSRATQVFADDAGHFVQKTIRLLLLIVCARFNAKIILSFHKCPLPCDHIPRRSWALFQARDLLRGVIESFNGSRCNEPSSSTSAHDASHAG